MDVSAQAESPVPPDADAHGRAALLLVESLIHGLTSRGILPVVGAIEIMEVALDAQQAVIEDAAQPAASMMKAMTLLSSLVESLRTDLPGLGAQDSQ